MNTKKSSFVFLFKTTSPGLSSWKEFITRRQVGLIANPRKFHPRNQKATDPCFRWSLCELLYAPLERGTNAWPHGKKRYNARLERDGC